MTKVCPCGLLSCVSRFEQTKVDTVSVDRRCFSVYHGKLRDRRDIIRYSIQPNQSCCGFGRVTFCIILPQLWERSSGQCHNVVRATRIRTWHYSIVLNVFFMFPLIH